MTIDLEVRLHDFIAKLDIDALKRAASRSSAEHAALVSTYVNEAVVGLQLILPFLSGRRRILEVGSGIGLLTSFLKSEGYDITGLEPGEGSEGGFDFMPALHAAITEHIAPEHKPTILPLGAEHLDPDTHGRFDLIFSANVVEHIQPLGAAIGALSRVLAPGGVMRHVCPNYHFPYEPHLAIPLVPFAPKLTCHVLSSKIASNGHIWRTLNFVTATRMRRLARANGLDIEFEKGVMGRFFGRLREDPVFARRHRGLLTSIAKTTVVGPLIESFLRAIPPMAATPMIMTLKHVTPRTTV